MRRNWEDLASVGNYAKAKVAGISNHFISCSNFRASRNNASICLRSAVASPANRPCLRAFWFPLGAPESNAPPCMRQRCLLRTTGEWHDPPERVFAPQRGLASIGAVSGS